MSVKAAEILSAAVGDCAADGVSSTDPGTHLCRLLWSGIFLIHLPLDVGSSEVAV